MIFSVSSVYTGQQFKCGRSSCPAGVNCATYPCLLVKVTYTPPGGSTREVPLYDSQHELFARGEVRSRVEIDKGRHQNSISVAPDFHIVLQKGIT